MTGTNRLRLSSVFKQALVAFRNDDASRFAAALAYYTIFSIVPMFLIAIAIAGDAVRQRLDEAGWRPAFHFFASSTPRVPQLAALTKVQGPDRRKFIELDVQGVIAKPFDPLTLGQKIREALAWPAPDALTIPKDVEVPVDNFTWRL